MAVQSIGALWDLYHKAMGLVVVYICKIKIDSDGDISTYKTCIYILVIRIYTSSSLQGGRGEMGRRDGEWREGKCIY